MGLAFSLSSAYRAVDTLGMADWWEGWPQEDGQDILNPLGDEMTLGEKGSLLVFKIWIRAR